MLFKWLQSPVFPVFKREDSQSTKQNLLVLLGLPKGISWPLSGMSWLGVRSRSGIVREQCCRRVLSTYLVFPNKNPRDNLLVKNIITHLHIWLEQCWWCFFPMQWEIIYAVQEFGIRVLFLLLHFCDGPGLSPEIFGFTVEFYCNLYTHFNSI